MITMDDTNLTIGRCYECNTTSTSITSYSYEYHDYEYIFELEHIKEIRSGWFNHVSIALPAQPTQQRTPKRIRSQLNNKQRSDSYK